MTIVLPMLAAMPLADTDTPSTTVWLDLLARHEEAEDTKGRMKAHATVARRVDEDGVVTMDGDAAAEAAWQAFIATLTPWLDHATEAREMVAVLGAALDHLAALPVDDLAAWGRGCGLYLRLRYAAGPVRPLPPSAPWRDWRWGGSLATWRTDAQRDHWWPCRARYLALARPARLAAAEEFGIREQSDLLHTIYPVAEQHALDRRAGLLCVDTRVRLDLEDKYLQAALAKRRGKAQSGVSPLARS